MNRISLCRAVARFFVKGGGGYSRERFSALVMRYVSEKSTSNKCEKAGVFSADKIISEVLLI